MLADLTHPDYSGIRTFGRLTFELPSFVRRFLKPIPLTPEVIPARELDGLSGWEEEHAVALFAAASEGTRFRFCDAMEG